jgi:hypothetical protein
MPIIIAGDYSSGRYDLSNDSIHNTYYKMEVDITLQLLKLYFRPIVYNRLNIFALLRYHECRIRNHAPILGNGLSHIRNLYSEHALWGKSAWGRSGVD